MPQPEPVGGAEHKEREPRRETGLSELDRERYQVISDLRDTLLEGKQWNPFSGEYEFDKDDPSWGLDMLDRYLPQYVSFEHLT